MVCVNLCHHKLWWSRWEERATGGGPEDATRHQILEDKQQGMWQAVDWLPPGFTGCKGNLSRQRGRSLQRSPDCSLCITRSHTRMHTHTSVPAQGLAPSTWPLSGAQRVYTPCDSGTLLSSWRWSAAPPTCLCCRELAPIELCVVWPSCPTSKGEKLGNFWNGDLHTASGQTAVTRSERIRDIFAFIDESNESMARPSRSAQSNRRRLSADGAKRLFHLDCIFLWAGSPPLKTGTTICQ